MKFWFQCLSRPRRANLPAAGVKPVPSQVQETPHYHAVIGVFVRVRTSRVTWLTRLVCAIASTCWARWCPGWRWSRPAPAPPCASPTPRWAACPPESSSRRAGRGWKEGSYTSTAEGGPSAAAVSPGFFKTRKAAGKPELFTFVGWRCFLQK